MKKIALFFSALLFSMMSFAGLGEGYSKVTDIATLSAGDKVVLYCDDAELGVTGWDGNKTATAAAAGWVEYVVEAADGGVLLKDGEQYISLTVKNTFKYDATGSVCNVNASGVLYCTLSDVDYFLYENANNGNPVYRMYADKTGNAQYKPFYVYTVGEGGGETPDQPEEPETPETPDTPTEPELPDTPEGVITCAQAMAICQATGETSTTETYTIRGYVTEIKTAYSEQYGNISLWLADTPDGGKVLQAFRVKPVNATDINVAAGDFVEVVGTLVNYMGNTPEVNAGGSYTIITAGEGGETPEQPEEPEIPEDPENPDTPAGAVIFDADVDQGNAGTDSNNASEYTVSKSGVTMTVSSGILGTYNNETHYRVYKNQTVTVTSTVGNITSIEVTCTANDDAKYGPGCFTVAEGDYSYSGPVGTWTGSAAEVVFTAATNQVRATQIVVTVNGEGGGETPEPEDPETPVDPEQPEIGVVEIKGLVYADAYYYEYDGVAYYDIDMYKDNDMDTYEYTYPEVYVSFEAKSKTALNGTYDVLYAGYWKSANDSVEINETTLGTVTIKNTDNESNYSISGSFLGTDGKKYTFNDVVNVWAFDYDNYEEIILSEDGSTDNPGTDEPGNDDPVTPDTPKDPETPAAEVTFDADVDQGNAGTDSNNASEYTVSKSGVTMTVSSGILGTYNNETHYRVYKNQTLTITSTVGNIISIEFTCTANGDTKYGPGCFTASVGDYTNDGGAVGTWTGSASEIVFTASSNQVRATQVVVKIAGAATDVEDIITIELPVKVLNNGQLMIISGENMYNILGTQIK